MIHDLALFGLGALFMYVLDFYLWNRLMRRNRQQLLRRPQIRGGPR